MSQKHELAIRGLQTRVTALEERLAALEDARPVYAPIGSGGIAPAGPFKATHKHLGAWIIEDGAGRVVDQYGTMKKADAKALAEELNGPQH